MVSGTLLALALVGAGFACGKSRKKPTAGSRSVVVRGVLILACIPFSGLWLASQLQSDTLGWIFGLSLMIGLPVVLLIGAGLVVGIWFRRRTAAGLTAPPAPDPAATVLVRVNRNSVHASDDAPEQSMVVASGISLAGLVEQIRRASFLPGIHGGQATWIIESNGHHESTDQDASPIGVLAEQWPAAAFTIGSSVPLSQHFAGRTANLFFRYRCQEDPDRVLAQIRTN